MKYPRQETPHLDHFHLAICILDSLFYVDTLAKSTRWSNIKALCLENSWGYRKAESSYSFTVSQNNKY